MSEEKGKGRANNARHDVKTLADDPLRQSTSSILDRVTASATGLARDALATPNNRELSDQVSASLSAAGKGQQAAGSRSSAFAEGSRPSDRSGLSALGGQSILSFRTTHGEQHEKNVEAEFSSFLDGIESFTPSNEAYDSPNSPQDLATNNQPQGPHRSIDGRHHQAYASLYNSVGEQQQHDGDEVLAILADSLSTAAGLDDLPVEDEVYERNLTDQQVSRLRAVIDELFPPAQEHVSPVADHPLNLVPDFNVPVTVRPPSFPAAGQAKTILHVDQGPPQETAKQVWMTQWEDVLTRYTDEVWGGLLPLVKEARQEIEAMKEQHSETSFEQPRALRRLRLVLNHLRDL